MKTGFFDLFPTPKFLEMPAPGLAVSEKALHLVEFTPGKTGHTISKYDTLQFPQPFFSEGIIENPQELVELLETFRKKNDLHYIRTSLPEERAYLFSTVVPALEGDELRATIESSIEENVPLSVSEAVFDYAIVGKQDFKGRPGLKVTVSALPEKVVSEYIDIFRASGFEPLHFEIESQAITKAVVPRGDSRVCLIVNLSAGKGGFYISDGGAVSFTATIPLSLFAESSGGIAQSPAVKEIVEEVKKIFLYWQTQADQKSQEFRPITHIVLTGDEGGREGLPEALSAQCSVSVAVANVWQNAFSLHDYIPDISKKDSLSFAAAVGLALPHKAK
jgi:type IV pilus assembly protein PilM